MKALLLKDFYMAKAYLRSFFILLLIFLFTSAAADGNMFLILYPMIISVMAPVSLISYDEKFKWDRYCDIMPFTRAQFVSAKYMFSLICCLLFFALSAIVQGFIFLPEDKGTYFNIMALLLSIGLISPALTMPFIFKFGSEKGRYMYYFVVGVIAAVSILLSYDKMLPAPISAFPMPPLLCIVSILLFPGSWLLSIRFYQKRSL